MWHNWKLKSVISAVWCPPCYVYHVCFHNFMIEIASLSWNCIPNMTIRCTGKRKWCLNIVVNLEDNDISFWCWFYISDYIQSYTIMTELIPNHLMKSKLRVRNVQTVRLIVVYHVTMKNEFVSRFLNFWNYQLESFIIMYQYFFLCIQVQLMFLCISVQLMQL